MCEAVQNKTDYLDSGTSLQFEGSLNLSDNIILPFSSLNSKRFASSTKLV